MKKNSSEIVFNSKNKKEGRNRTRLLKIGRLRKLAPKIYTTNLEETAAEIFYRNRYHIASHLYPGAIISHRTAFEGDVKPGGTLFLTYFYPRKLFFPGLTIQLIKSEFSKEGANTFLESLYISGYERTLLENLQPVTFSIAMIPMS
jgi:hypothetical protein